jgi:predicted dithiol-disulfide oxidoreductase (DUF899 family)
MTAHATATRAEWLAARKELLEHEKELTRRGDEIAAERRELPWVEVEKEYVFETNDGPKTLAELFDGRSQLIVYHLMYGPDDDAACSGCSFYSDHLDGSVPHVNHQDVTLVCASRAPLAALNAYKERMGWRFPWVSSGDTGFNLDFSAFTEEERRTGAGFNFGSAGGSHLNLHDMELMALSVFALDDGVVYHTYSCFDRGTDGLNGTWQLLDRVPKGRDGGEAGGPGRHDEYDVANA